MTRIGKYNNDHQGAARRDRVPLTANIMTARVIAYQVADSIDTRSLKQAYPAPILYSETGELLFEPEENRYIFIFRYGVVCFYNFPADQISTFLSFAQPYFRNAFREPLSDEFPVITDTTENKVRHDHIEVARSDSETLRMIMLNVAQSVALDYYSNQTTQLMEDSNYHTQVLAKRGRLAISGISLKKYIGRTLLLKNRIAENLYIFDSPPETWENESLDKLNKELSRNLELQERYRSIAEGLAIVKENLELFKDLLQYRYSSILEWIIIGLIAFEILNFLLQKFIAGG